MNPNRRLLVVLGCALCILLVASLFPAADPRIEVAGAGEGEEQIKPNDEQTQTPTPTPEGPSEKREQEETDESIEPLDPELTEIPIPGRSTGATVDDSALEEREFRHAELLLNGEYIGYVGTDEVVSFEVPSDAAEINITVEETGESATFLTETDVEITTSGARVPGQEIDITATVAGHDVQYADITVDGERVGSTSANGEATVVLPDAAGETEIQVQEGALSGRTAVDVQEPEVAISSPEALLLPGMLAHISVTADGQDVEDATVTLSDGSSTSTGQSGTLVTLPIADEVTVTAQVGDEQTSTTISNLYLRTTFVVLVVPGLLIGVPVTYLWLVGRRDTRLFRRRSKHGLNLNEMILSLAGFFGLVGGTVWSLGSIRLPRPSLPRFRLPRPSISAPSISWPGLPNPSLGGSLESIIPSPGAPNSSMPSSVTDIFGDDSDEDSPETVDPSASPEEPAQVDSETELRRTWHRFLDQVGLRNRETQTPGEASRYAVAAGYPRRSVRQLLSLFRHVEYSDAEPSSDEISDARNALENISEQDSEEDSE